MRKKVRNYLLVIWGGHKVPVCSELKDIKKKLELILDSSKFGGSPCPCKGSC